MEIFALSGHKVKCTNLSGGHDHHQEIAKQYLEVDKIYTVCHTDVGDWHTDVELKEFPNVEFNSVFFEDVEEQDAEFTKSHHDYHKFQ